MPYFKKHLKKKLNNVTVENIDATLEVVQGCTHSVFLNNPCSPPGNKIYLTTNIAINRDNKNKQSKNNFDRTIGILLCG